VEGLIARIRELFTVFGVKILAAVVVFIMGLWFAKLMRKIVTTVMIFSTQPATPDNKTIVVPNSKITGDNVVNSSTKGTRRMDMVFGIGYEGDINKARNIITEILSQDERIIKNPPANIVVSVSADCSVNFIVRPWVNSSDYSRVYRETTEKIKKKFDAEGISIPCPQRDIYVYERKLE
jgi:small conductance mechanosensitive channel